MNKKLIPALAVIAIALLFVEGIGYFLASGSIDAGKSGEKAKSVNALKAKNRALKGRLDALYPRGVHIIVDTAQNVLYLKNGQKALRTAVVSCGSGSILEDPSGERKWVFDTPRGVYSVEAKHVKPNWIKPDWAFIEEGEPLPKSYKDRVEPGMLGDFALGFGNGFFIHGTLYTRLLGRNVTHGCVRVGDEDLEAVYNSAPVGAEIIIF
jgi:L,D-transpeptidase YbiS